MLDRRDRTTRANILRVDHAGECGAIRIYQAQLRFAQVVAPDLLPFLQATLADECHHRDRFARMMHVRSITPCRMLTVWGVGGWVLGAGTALLGRRAILVCTEAVERTVHRHMVDQADWLSDKDADLRAAIEAIRVEELAHLDGARGRHPIDRSITLSLLDRVVAGATEALVWCSTYGASTRMLRAIAR